MITYVIAWLRVLKNRLGEQRAQDVVEYALLVGGIGLAIAAVLLVTPISTYMGEFATAIGNCVNITADTYQCP